MVQSISKKMHGLFTGTNGDWPFCVNEQVVNVSSRYLLSYTRLNSTKQLYTILG